MSNNGGSNFERFLLIILVISLAFNVHQEFRNSKLKSDNQRMSLKIDSLKLNSEISGISDSVKLTY